MLIHVEFDGPAASHGARAYAEYRFFSALTRHARQIRSVQVVVCPADAEKHPPGLVTCRVDVALEPSGVVRARAQQPHTYGAIDDAAERIGDRMDHRA